MADLLDCAAFVEAGRRLPIFDVRAPSEYAQGHVPGAHNLPLFSDDERAEIGTLYKQEGRRAAMLRGLDLIGPKMRAMVEQAAAQTDGSEVLVHCWRGGMRSESVAWLLGFMGLRARRLEGGYKAFRHFVLDTFAQPWSLRILSGRTGSGKTEVLHAMAERGAQIIDLEALAHHKGSVFGGFGQAPAPTQQQFENELALHLRQMDPKRPVWLEDESRRIGRVNVPDELWKQMRASPVYVVDVPLEQRVERLVDEYGAFDNARLKEAICLVERRLGGVRTQHALEALDTGDLATACSLLLHYYDRAYDHGLGRRDPSLVQRIATDSHEATALAAQVLRGAKCG